MSRTQKNQRSTRASTPPRSEQSKDSRSESAPASEETRAPLAPPNPAGKYALLEVPGFASDAERGTEMTSFVRLGVPNRHHELDGGADLLKTAKGAGWSSDHIDTRGGLRDHSDGDRVSTTRGHKIDVISGNYKKVLASDRTSGGSVREDHAHDGGVLTLSTKKANVVERNETHGERYETFTGPKLERNTGVSKGTIINDTVLANVQKNTRRAEQDNQPPVRGGSTNETDVAEGPSGSEGESGTETETPETPEQPDEAPPPDDGEASGEAEAEAEEEDDGDVKSIEQETSIGNSSELNAGLVMNSQTFALAINETTGAGMISEQTVVGRSDSMTLAGSMVETTWAGEMHSVTAAMLIAEATHAAVSTSVTQAGVINEATMAGVIMSDTKAGALFETTMIPLQTTLNVGDSVDVRLGNQTSVAGGLALEVWAGGFTELFFGVALSFRIAGSAEVTIGAGAEVFAGLSAEVFLGAKLEVTLAGVIEFSVGKKMEVGEMKDVTSTTLTNLAAKMQSMAAAVHLG